MNKADIETAVTQLRQSHTEFKQPIDMAMILGSGLGDIAQAQTCLDSLPYADIAGYPVPTSPVHKGHLHLASISDKRVLIFQGRLHLYEGYQPCQVAAPVFLCWGLGVKHLLVTNAAGALNPKYRPGDLMWIEDHINFTGQSPLRGREDDGIGVRFPDMSRAYDPEWLEWAEQLSESEGIATQSGIYIGVPGPELETSAERRFMRSAGADAVGMSTIMETIAANYCGLKVLGLSAITNSATGLADQKPDTIEEVLLNAAFAAKKIQTLLPELVKQFPD